MNMLIFAHFLEIISELHSENKNKSFYYFNNYMFLGRFVYII